MGGLDALLVHEAGDFHRAVVGDVGDEVFVGDVSVDNDGLAGLHSVDDVGAILDAFANGDGLIVFEHSLFGVFPSGDDGFAAADVFVERDSVIGDDLVAVVNEVGAVFGEVFAGLGDEVAEAAHHLEADFIGCEDLGVFEGFEEEGVGVLAAVFELQEEGDVVYASDFVADVFIGEADVARELAGGALDAVAKADGGDLANAVDGHHVHGHGVGVIEVEWAIGAEVAEHVADFYEFGHGAEGAEDAADAEGIGNGLAEAVFLGDFEVGDGARLVTADLDHGDHVAGACAGFLEVHGGLDFRGGLELGDYLVGQDFGDFEAGGVDVHQADGGADEGRVLQDVAD